ncbi:MAG TPA: hypothetical protein VF133_16885 [Terriglobales bacterium]
MPHTLRTLPAREFHGSPTARDVAAVFFRHRRLVVSSFFAFLVAGVLYAILTPSYRAQMKILLTRGRIDPAVTPTDTAPPLIAREDVSEQDLNSEAELLRANDVLRQVVMETGLADRTSWLARLLPQDREQRVAHAVGRLAQRLDVQPVRKSQLIAVSYKASDPQLAAAVLNSLAHAYLAKQVDIRHPNAQQEFFEQQMQESRRALNTAQDELIAFTRRREVASAALERDLALQKLSDAQAADRALVSAIAEAAARVRVLEGKLRELPERRVVEIRNSDNPELQGKLKSRLLELQLRRTELLTKYQPSYRLVEEVEHEIAETRAAIEAENVRPLRTETTDQNPDYAWASAERLKNMVEMEALEKKEKVAREQLAVYRSEAERLGEGAVVQSDLEDKLKAAEGKYLLYARKREEARIGDALDRTGILNVTLAEPPRVPALPVWPLWAMACLSVATAGILSTGAAFTADYLDSSFRTPHEVIRILGTPVLASLPGPENRSQRVLGGV